MDINQDTVVVGAGGFGLLGGIVWALRKVAPWIGSIFANKESAEIAAAKVSESAAKQLERLETEANRLSEKLSARDAKLDELEKERDDLAEQLRELKSKIGNETTKVLAENRTLKKRITILEMEIEKNREEITRLKAALDTANKSPISDAISSD